jgi:endonuclease/exonuclease/phosphatase (EEP) superfamily protein YafD
LRLDWPSPDKPLTLLITHLDRTDGHLQRPIVLRRFADAPPPAALLGDFNATRSELADFFSLPHVTEALDADPPPQTRIDWLFTKGLRISRAQLVNTTASDHPLLWADVELP